MTLVVNSGQILFVDISWPDPITGIIQSGSYLTEPDAQPLFMPGVFTVTDVTVNLGGTVELFDTGGTAIDTTVNTSGLLDGVGVFSGTVVNGGDLYVDSGGMAQATTILNVGVETVDGGSDSGAIISSGIQGVGLLDTATASDAMVFSGGSQDVGPFGTAIRTTVSNGGALGVVSGTASGALILSGGIETIATGGIDYGATIDGAQGVVSGGRASGVMVSSGGFQGVTLGGTAYATVVDSGGQEFVAGPLSGVGAAGVVSGTIISGGTMEVASGAIVSGDITFVGSGGMLILDDAADFTSNFTGTISGLDVGDKIVLQNTSFASGNGVVAATIGTLGGKQNLQIREAPDKNPRLPDKGGKAFLLGEPSNPGIPILGATGSGSLAEDFFEVTQTQSGVQDPNGPDTTLTLTPGNPIDIAVDGPSARAEFGVYGSGIKIGLLSKGDEQQAMKQIIGRVAPNAEIMTDPDPFTVGLATAIATMQQAGCQVIVNDLNSIFIDQLGETSDVETKIYNAVTSGVTFITTAGNDRSPLTPILGFAASPDALTVAAMNFLATPVPPSNVGGYITPPQTEPFSQTGFDSTKPDITGPDGGPTLFPLLPQNNFNPFFGTSAAAAVVAAVAALMRQANLQLTGKATDQLLEQSAIPFTDPNAEFAGGAGLVNADTAVAAALEAKAPFYNDPQPALSVASAMLSLRPGSDGDTGSTIRLQLTMNAAVTITGGSPAFTLSDGGIATYDATGSDPATGTLVFDYTVGASDRAANLAISAFDPNGTVQDANGNSADFSGLLNVPTGVSINSPLVVTSVTASQGGEVQVGQTVELMLSLNEPGTVNTAGGAPTVSLNNDATATYDAAASNPGVGTLVFDYIVAAKDAPTPNLSVAVVNLPNGTTVQDANGNNADFSGVSNQETRLQVGPAFVNEFYSSPTGAASTGQSVQLTLVMSEGVVVNTAGGFPTLSLNDEETAIYDSRASDAAAGTLVFDYTVASQDQIPDLVITQVNLNGASIQDENGVSVDFSGALNFPSELSINSPLVATQVSASQTGTVTPGQTIQLTLKMSEGVVVDTLNDFGGPPTLTLNDGATASYDSTASNPSTGVLVFDYMVGASDHTPDLAITEVNLAGPIFTDSQGYQADFSAALNVGTGVDVVCYARGTRLRTPDGELPIERLRASKQVITLVDGQEVPKKVVWIGHRRIEIAGHPRPETVAPVRVRRDAFADSMPHADLLVSPDHAIFVDGKLICARQLVNGSTIRQETEWTAVDYYHVELDQHAILLAEGLPAESYLDTGNSGFFENSGAPLVLHPDLTDASNYPTREAGSCAPFVWDEASVRPIWQRLADRAAIIGQPIPQRAVTTEPNLRIRGKMQERQSKPIHADSKLAIFVLPRSATQIHLLSHAQSPTEARPWLDDRRRLGVRVQRIVLRGAQEVREVPMDHPNLTKGWWDIERDGQMMSRWTNGDAVIPLPEMDGHVMLEIHLAGETIYAVETDKEIEAEPRVAA